MSTIAINGSKIGSALQSLLEADEIVPGAAPSYELCKIIYSYHPLGVRMTDSPIKVAQSKPREITVGGAPDEVRDAFLAQWAADGCDDHVKNVGSLARVYGIASLAVVSKGQDPKEPLDFATLWKSTIAFNVLDPLNTAGSLVLNQDPNSLDFQKHASISVAGKPYARNRSVTLMNEKPLYIEYTTSAFGFVGRSVYQRPLFPLKSFVGTMVTDDMVTRKAGLIIAMIKGAGSVVDNLMMKITGIKRSLLKQGVVDGVLSVGPDDKIESLNLQNLEGPAGQARGHILKNIANAMDAPAIILENDTLTEGFGEGTEDAKVVATYVDGVRKWLKPVYDFLDPVEQRRAWNPDFFKRMQRLYPEEYGGRDYDEVFLDWSAAFSAIWPSLVEEPESEKVKVDDVKFKAILATVEVLGPQLDPENKATLFEWVADNLNENKLLFKHPLELDMDLLAAWDPSASTTTTENEDGEETVSTGVGKMSMKLDSAGPNRRRALAYYEDAVKRLPLRAITGGRRDDA